MLVKITKQKCVIKKKLKFEDYKNCLEATQTENKINHLEKNKTDSNSFKEDHKELVKNSKLMLKTQQRRRSEKHVLLKKSTRLL